MSAPHRNRELHRLITVFYLSMTAAGGLLVFLRWESPPRFQPFAPPALGVDLLLHALGTAGLLAIVLALSEVARVSSSAVREFGEDVRQLLGPLGRRRIFYIAVLSGVGEELFFRGWLLNETGLVISSLLFGLVHFPRKGSWIFWPFFAAAVGFLLGLLCLWTGTVLWAALLHGGVNFINLSRLLGGECQGKGSVEGK